MKSNFKHLTLSAALAALLIVPNSAEADQTVDFAAVTGVEYDVGSGNVINQYPFIAYNVDFASCDALAADHQAALRSVEESKATNNGRSNWAPASIAWCVKQSQIVPSDVISSSGVCEIIYDPTSTLSLHEQILAAQVADC